MTVLHLHLLLNHIPVLGAVILVFIFGFAAARRNSTLSRVGLVTCVLLASLTGVVYLTGGGAEDLAEKIAGVSELSISLHEEAAEVSAIAFGAAGILALACLILFRRKPIPQGVAVAALACTLIVAALMAWTANLGGNIRHTELQTTPTPTQGPGDH